MERFIRKLFGLTFSALLAVVLLVGCISNTLGDEKSMNIKIDGIEQITVSTQTTGQKQLIKIEKKGGEITLISFMDNKVKVNDSVYKVSDYNIDDFSYLFE